MSHRRSRTSSSTSTRDKVAAIGAVGGALRHLHQGQPLEAALTVAAPVATHGAHAAVKKAIVATGSKAGQELLRATGEAALKKAAGKGIGHVAKTALRGNVIGSIVGLVIDQGADTARLAAGSIDSEQYARQTCENVAGAGGGLGGAAAGAALGTLICPGIGTCIGGFLGSVFGDAGARRLVR